MRALLLHRRGRRFESCSAHLGGEPGEPSARRHARADDLARARARRLSALRRIALASACALACRAASDLLPGRDPTAPPVRPTAARTRVSTPDATLGPTPGPIEDVDAAQGLLPEFSADLAAVQGATRYLLDVSVDFDPAAQQARIEGMARILITNREDTAWKDLALMLWPNDPQYRSSMAVGAALVEGQIVPPEPELGGLAIRLELPRPEIGRAHV